MPESVPTDNPTAPATVPIEALATALGDPTRWAILAELSEGEPRMVVELAERTGRSANALSKHLAVLRRAHVVTANRAGLYTVPAQFRSPSNPRHLDFGPCLLRFDRAE